MDFELLDARVYGDVAVVLAHGTDRDEWRSESFASDEWVTDVFVRRPGGWRCAMSALTPNYAADGTAPEGSSMNTGGLPNEHRDAVPVVRGRRDRVGRS